jgi:gamma-glutamyl-gamma-aminobutyrate hydrolase PuuD
MLTFEYQQVIAAAGGIPIPASPFAYATDLESMADGWLITGGDDFPGELLGQETHPEATLAHPMRYPFEKSLFGEFFPGNKPILGICFGSQFLALMAGGSIEQHLPDVLGHANHTEGATSVIASGRLSEIVGVEPFEVACFHHQGIADVGAGWSVSARAADGTVEAIEHESRWAFGVQWHPERTAESAASKALFGAFVAEASRRR